MRQTQNSAEKALRYRDKAATIGALSEHLENGTPAGEVGRMAPHSMTRDMVLAACAQTKWNLDRNTMLSFTDADLVHGAEELRALRSRLCQAQGQRGLKSVLVASALPQEGRSFVAANLAQVLALQPKCRVLLIDGDLRKPRLHDVLGTSSAPGVTEYLLQEADELRVMQRGEGENLYFIPCGRAADSPTELIATGRLKRLMDELEPLFDWIVVDSPPAISTSDACLLANYCDKVLMVVRGNSTPFDVVRKAQRRFRGESVLGVVLNIVDHDAIAERSGSSSDKVGAVTQA